MVNDDIIVVTDGFWNTVHRIRHRMPLHWARAGNRVLWVEQTPFPPGDWHPGRLVPAIRGQLNEPEPNLWTLASPPALPRLHGAGFPGSLLRALHGPWMAGRINRASRKLGFREPLLVIFQQAARLDLVDRIPHRRLIYYNHDLFGYGTISTADAALEAGLCRRADLVWTTSEKQQQALLRHNQRTHHLPHAVEPEVLDPAKRRGPDPFHELALGRPRLLFTGALDDRIDWSLLLDVADRRPDWNLVLVGDRERVPDSVSRGRTANLLLVGRRPAADLPRWCEHADVLLLPYQVNEMTRSIGLPLKFHEYMASGKPVVATPFSPFPEGLVQVADGGDRWLEAVEAALSDRDARTAEARRALAAANSYDARLAEQRRLLRQLDE